MVDLGIELTTLPEAIRKLYKTLINMPGDEERLIANVLRQAGQGKYHLYGALSAEYYSRELDGKSGELVNDWEHSFLPELKSIIRILESIRNQIVERKAGPVGLEYALHLEQCIKFYEMLGRTNPTKLTNENLKELMNIMSYMIETGERSARRIEHPEYY